MGWCEQEQQLVADQARIDESIGQITGWRAELEAAQRATDERAMVIASQVR